MLADVRPKLQVSNSYNLDLPQTARLLQWLEEKDLPRWSMDAAAADLGLARRNTENLGSMATAIGFTRPATARLTRLGEVLRRLDPYLSGEIVPWVVHYNLGANPKHIIWHRMVNEVIPDHRSLSQQDAKSAFEDLLETHTRKAFDKHVGAELTVFFNAYTDGALSRLSYLGLDNGTFSVPLALKVPPAAFGYALLTYATVYRDGDVAIPIEDIASALSSPGRVYLMRDYDVHHHLERMHRDGVISIESRAHLDQIRITTELDPADYLAQHYDDTLEAEL